MCVRERERERERRGGLAAKVHLIIFLLLFFKSHLQRKLNLLCIQGAGVIKRYKTMKISILFLFCVCCVRRKLFLPLFALKDIFISKTNTFTSTNEMLP